MKKSNLILPLLLISSLVSCNQTTNKPSTSSSVISNSVENITNYDEIKANGLTTKYLEKLKESYSFSAIKDEIIDKTLEGFPIPVQRSVFTKIGSISNDSAYFRNFSEKGASYDTVEKAYKDSHIYTDNTMVEELDSELYTATKDGVTNLNGPVLIPTLTLENKIKYAESNNYTTYIDSKLQNAFSFLPDNIPANLITENKEKTELTFLLFDSSKEQLSSSPYKTFIENLASQTCNLEEFDETYNLKTVKLITDGEHFKVEYDMQGISSQDYDFPYYTKLFITITETGDTAKESIKLPQIKTGTEDEKLKLAFSKVNTKNYTLDIVNHSLYLPAGTIDGKLKEELSYTRILSTEKGQIKYEYDKDNNLLSTSGFLIVNNKKQKFIGANINGEINYFKNGALEEINENDYQQIYKLSPLFFSYKESKNGYIYDNSSSLTESDLNLGYESKTPLTDLVVSPKFDTAFGAQDNLLSIGFINTIYSSYSSYASNIVLSSYDVTTLPEITLQDNTDNIPWETILGKENYQNIPTDLGINYNLDDQTTSSIDFKDYLVLPFFSQGYLDWDYYSYNKEVFLSSKLKEGDNIDTLISNYQNVLTTKNYFKENGTTTIGDTITTKLYTKTFEDEDTGDTIKFNVAVYPSHSIPKEIYIRLSTEIIPAE